MQTLLTSYTLADNVENLALISLANGGPAPGTVTTNFVWTGNALNNIITSNGGADALNGAGGNDTLNGGAGDDVLTGGADDDTANGGAGNDRFVATLNDGDDTYNGGADVDTYDLSATVAGAIVTITTSTSAETGTDVLSSIANFIGSQGDDSITVNGGVNVIDGQGGHDTINAGGGSDSVSGGAGNDTFAYTIGDGADTVDGGADADTLNIIGTAANNTLDVIWNGTAITQFELGTVTGVEAITADLLDGTDRLSYAGTTEGVSVNLTAGTASGFASISSIENVTGGSGADTLTGSGNAQVNNLAGGGGDDTYFADLGDTITEAADGGIDTVSTTSATFTLAANVENLTFTGAGNFTGNGNGSNNVITGNGGTDVLNGNGGADTLIGNGAVDSLNGGAGNDVLIGGAGNDVMNGGAGSDIFVFADGFGNDIINQFDANATDGQDLLDISDLGITAETFAAEVSIVDLGNDTLVTIGANTITLLGVTGVGANTITQEDFILL